MVAGSSAHWRGRGHPGQYDLRGTGSRVCPLHVGISVALRRTLVADTLAAAIPHPAGAPLDPGFSPLWLSGLRIDHDYVVDEPSFRRLHEDNEGGLRGFLVVEPVPDQDDSHPPVRKDPRVVDRKSVV